MLRKILIVEDDRGSALLLRRNLEKVGYYVFLAGNGLEALDLLDKQSVDVVVTDVVMPHMDGVDLYDALKKRPETQNLPIIIMTDKQLFIDAFTSLGVEHFYAKGSGFNLLLDEIKKVNQKIQKEGYQKILVSGSNPMVVEQMRNILVAKRYLVATADSSINTLQQAFLMVPHIILLDLKMQDHSDAKELVKSLRCFHLFYSVKILTYTYLSGGEMDFGSLHWQINEMNARECEENGEAKYIGNFSQATFLKVITDHIDDIPAPALTS